VEGYASFEAQLLPCKPCEIKAGIEGGIEANLSFFSYDFVEAKYPDIINQSKLIYECSEDICNTQASFIDTRDGQEYKIVTIGSQVWMAENLNYDTGNSLCYDSNTENCDKFGCLYDRESVLTACPSGWHLPTYDEWLTLSDYLGGLSVAGGKLKSLNSWSEPNIGATNESGFSALPGGFMSYNNFQTLQYFGAWWTSSVSNGGFFWTVNLRSSSSALTVQSVPDEVSARSCRCIKD
jgi:uncharacterized protein (TIGR02145 family)